MSYNSCKSESLIPGITQKENDKLSIVSHKNCTPLDPMPKQYNLKKVGNEVPEGATPANPTIYTVQSGENRNNDVRKDHYNTEINKKGKQKVTWIDKVNKEKVNVAEVIIIQNFSKISSNTKLLAEPLPVTYKNTKAFGDNDKTVQCKCIIF